MCELFYASSTNWRKKLIRSTKFLFLQYLIHIVLCRCIELVYLKCFFSCSLPRLNLLMQLVGYKLAICKGELSNKHDVYISLINVKLTKYYLNWHDRVTLFTVIATLCVKWLRQSNTKLSNDVSCVLHSTVIRGTRHPCWHDIDMWVSSTEPFSPTLWWAMPQTAVSIRWTPVE